MPFDELGPHSRIPQLVKAIKDLVERVEVMEDFIMGDPTPQEILDGKPVGIVGMMKKAEDDRRRMKQAMYGVLCLLFVKALVDAPTSIPNFIIEIQKLFR